MTYTSLKEIIDDILLLVRNNNISESEDLSRAQIALWIRTYKAAIIKDRFDKQKAGLLDDDDVVKLIDSLYIREKGPLELEDVQSLSDKPTFLKRTKDALENIYDNDENSILAIYDQQGEIIQYMSHTRRHYQYFRKYTFGEMTGYYKDDGHVYIEGTADKGKLKYIWVEAIFDTIDDDEDSDNMDESDVKIPSWMVPLIKQNIMKYELGLMVEMPSDDSNNATLSSIKKPGPQDNEK